MTDALVDNSTDYIVSDKSTDFISADSFSSENIETASNVSISPNELKASTEFIASKSFKTSDDIEENIKSESMSSIAHRQSAEVMYISEFNAQEIEPNCSSSMVRQQSIEDDYKTPELLDIEDGLEEINSPKLLVNKNNEQVNSPKSIRGNDSLEEINLIKLFSEHDNIISPRSLRESKDVMEFNAPKTMREYDDSEIIKSSPKSIKRNSYLDSSISPKSNRINDNIEPEIQGNSVSTITHQQLLESINVINSPELYRINEVMDEETQTDESKSTDYRTAKSTDTIDDFAGLTSVTIPFIEDNCQSNSDIKRLSRVIEEYISEKPPSVIRSEKNPVSSLLMEEDSPTIDTVKTKRNSFMAQVYTDRAMREYYTSTENAKNLQNVLKQQKKKEKKRTLVTAKLRKLKQSAGSLSKSIRLHKKDLDASNLKTVADPEVNVKEAGTSSKPILTAKSSLKIFSFSKFFVHRYRKRKNQKNKSTHDKHNGNELNTGYLVPSNNEARFVTMEEAFEYKTTTHKQQAEVIHRPEDHAHKPEAVSKEMKRNVKRMNVINELMETEETYGRDLDILCNHFFALLTDSTCITSEEAETLQRNAMDILSLQEDFTESLIEAYGYEEEEKHGVIFSGNLMNVAKCFIEWAPKLDVYLDYCVRQDQAVSLYNKLLQTNSEFSNLIERIHTFHRVSFGFNKLKFEDYLIMPLQRIFRYKLLLENIAKETNKDTEEYKVLIQAQEAIHEVAAKINDEKSKMEAQRKTELFLSRLHSDWSLPERWFSTLGPCILIGTLDVRLIGDNKAKRIGCALFNHYMIMAKAKKNNQYEPRHWFPLRKIKLQNLPNFEGLMTYSWLLRYDKKTLELGAICESEKQIWMDALSKAIKESSELNPDANDLEQFFVSSFDQKKQTRQTIDRTPESSDIPIFMPIPSGSASFSHSTFLTRLNRQENRASHPNFNTQESSILDVLSQNIAGNNYNSGVRSPTTIRSQSSMNDLKDYFSFNNVSEKWMQRKMNQYHAQCKTTDIKFEDVCTTPILTARANNLYDSRSYY